MQSSARDGMVFQERCRRTFPQNGFMMKQYMELQIIPRLRVTYFLYHIAIIKTSIGATLVKSVQSTNVPSPGQNTYQLSKTPSKVRTTASPANVVHAAWKPKISPHIMMFIPKYTPDLDICCARYCVGNSAARKPKSPD